MERRISLDGLRGFAAFVVLPYHVIFALDRTLMGRALYTPSAAMATSPYELWCKFWVTLLNGHAAVILFFMLSGCVLVQSARGGLARTQWFSGLLAFLVRRALRLMPALVVCVAILWAIAPPLDLIRLVENVSLYTSDVNGVTWTLRVEMLVAPILFAVAFIASSHREFWATIFLLASLAAAAFPILAFGNPEIARNLVYFAFGVIVTTRIGEYSGRLLLRIPFLVLVICFLFARRVVPSFELAILIQALMGFFVLSRVYYWPPGFLNAPLAQFAGQISYSFYLWNMLFVNLLEANLASLPLSLTRYPIEAGLPIAMAFGLATVPIAMASERYIERPGIAAGRIASAWITATTDRPKSSNSSAGR